MTVEAKFSIRTADGTQQEVPCSLADYQEAADLGLSLSQLMNLRYPTNVERDGTAFAQMAASCGLFLSEDRNFGIRPPSIKQIFEGKIQLNGGAIVRPDGTGSQTPSGRLLFPAVLLDLLEATLRDNTTGYVGAALEMVAFTRTINSPKYDQVIVNYANPQAAVSQPIGQLTRPARMLTITVSDVSKTIPTYAIGLEISQEAQAAATLDLIGLAVREQAIAERATVLDRDLTAISNGDTDAGSSALSSVTFQSFDSTISSAGVATQKAWVKYLRTNWRKRTITDVICDIDTYLAIEGRTNRPTVQNISGMDERLNTIPNVRLPGVPGTVSFFVTETSLLGANTLLGLDRSKAIRRVVYTAAQYSATEEFVMRKSTAMRMDWAERLERAGYDDAFSKATLTV